MGARAPFSYLADALVDALLCLPGLALRLLSDRLQLRLALLQALDLEPPLLLWFLRLLLLVILHDSYSYCYSYCLQALDLARDRLDVGVGEGMAERRNAQRRGLHAEHDGKLAEIDGGPVAPDNPQVF